jgi:hypothetical protein
MWCVAPNRQQGALAAMGQAHRPSDARGADQCNSGCAFATGWIVEVEPGVWAHEHDMLACTPAESLPLTYLEEVA